MGDERGFVHKKIFGGIKGAIGGILGGPTGILGGAIGGFVGGGGGQSRPPGAFGGFQIPTAIPGAAPAGCPPGFVSILGQCVPTSPVSVISRAFPQTQPPQPQRQPQFQQDVFGEARLGRFGAGLEPAASSVFTLSCPPGSVLGKQEADGSFLCYNKRDISNKERKWPRGRRPLLTGGEMRCISVASRAAKSLQRKEKQLQQLGLLKRPSRKAAPKQLGPGHHAHVAHD